MDQSPTDAEVISASFDNPAAFAELFERHASVLGAYLVRRVGKADGESLLGESFRIAFESRHRFDQTRSDARPWLYGIGSNLVMKHFRSQQRHVNAMSRLTVRIVDLETPFDESITENSHWVELWNRVAPGLDDLQTRDREVVMLYVFGGLSYSDIAAALEIPVGTVRSRLNRARRSMRRLAEDSGSPRPPLNSPRTGDTQND